MSIAIEKDSPVAPSVIFWNNFIVVLRFTMAFGGLLAFILLMQQDEPKSSQLLLLAVVIAVGSFRAGRDIESGIRFRRLRYKGIIIASRPAPVDEDSKRPWIALIPSYGLNKTFREQLKNLSDPILEKLDDSILYIQFAVGKNDAGDYVLTKVHSCDDVPDNCDKPAIHLFGYDEERDGRIWWGN